MKFLAVSEDIKAKKRKAQYLIAVQGSSQKEAAKAVGISERTMCLWVARHKWKTRDDPKGGFKSVMNGFIGYLRKNDPEVWPQVSKHLEGYFKELDIGFNPD